MRCCVDDTPDGKRRSRYAASAASSDTRQLVRLATLIDFNILNGRRDPTGISLTTSDADPPQRCRPGRGLRPARVRPCAQGLSAAGVPRNRGQRRCPPGWPVTDAPEHGSGLSPADRAAELRNRRRTPSSIGPAVPARAGCGGRGVVCLS